MTVHKGPVMLNEELKKPPVVRSVGRCVMGSEFVVAAFIMAIGLSIAGTGTHLYQWRAGEQAMLRFDGKTFLHTLGHLGMSFICGPYIMLQMGWKQEDDGTLSIASALVSALVAFGWAFITGLLFLAAYFSVVH